MKKFRKTIGINGLFATVVLIAITFALAFGLSSCGGGASGDDNETPAQPGSLVLSVPSQYKVVQPDGQTRIPVTVTVYDTNGSPMGGQSVAISADPGIGGFDAAVKQTGDDGSAVFYYTVPSYDEASEAGADSVTIEASLLSGDTQVQGSVKIQFEETPARVVPVIPAEDALVPADGKTQIPVTVYALRQDGTPMAGVRVYAFASPNLGSFDKLYAETDEGGIATFTYTVPTRTSVLAVGAKGVTLSFSAPGASVNGSVDVAFNNLGTNTPAAIMLSASPTTIFTSDVLAGPKTSKITAQVVDSDGQPVLGCTVKFTIDKAPNGVYLTPAESEVDDNGTAYTVLHSGLESGSVIVSASVTVGTKTVTASTTLYIASGQSSSITLTESGTVTAEDDNGTRSVNIFALVKDANGNPVADGTVIVFSLSDPCGGIIGTSAETVSGVATTRLVYPAVCIGKDFSVTAQTADGIIEGSYSGTYRPAGTVALVLTGAPTSVAATGGDVSITGTLKDEGGSGLPISDETVLFSADADNVTFSPTSSPKTDINGNVNVTATIPALPDNVTSRTITITGQSGTAIDTVTVQQQ